VTKDYLNNSRDWDGVIMAKEEFLRIKQEKDKFTYTSMNYTEYEEVSDYKILCKNEKVILLYGYSIESGRNQYHWASNTAEDLISRIDIKNENVLITFVPSDWVEKLKHIGFEVFAIWNDYNNPDINSIQYDVEPEYLTGDECKLASQVTLSCRGQSRGFTGQTEEWFRQWINGTEPSSESTGVQNGAVFVERDHGKIVGIICTATYAHGSKKGPIVWVREVAVHPAFQRKGIARKLIMQALAYGKNHGATRGFLMADECNEHAIHLYESMGFKANKDEMEIDMIR
jgi:ribosomal protein S18 acetylase RimI-like enzyme